MAKTMTEHEFNDCLQKNKIVNFVAARKLVARELKAGKIVSEVNKHAKIILLRCNNGFLNKQLLF